MTHDENGQWRSVEPTMLRRGQWLTGAYYRNELAHGLKELGYGITPVIIGNTRSFEIEGYSRPLIEAWSTPPPGYPAIHEGSQLGKQC